LRIRPGERSLARERVAPEGEGLPMTDAFAVRGERAKAPWHLWALALASLLWFAGGANDYVMTRTANAAYLGMAAESMGITVQEILAYFADYPLWASVCWALGV